MSSAHKELRDGRGNKLEINTQINKRITNYDKTDEGSTKLGLRNNDWVALGLGRTLSLAHSVPAVLASRMLFETTKYTRAFALAVPSA